MNYLLYGNGGSGNHGCEAIIRGTYAVLGDGMRVMSQKPEEDSQYGIGNFAEILSAIAGKAGKFDWLKAYAKLKILKDFADMDGIAYLSAIRRAKGQAGLALSVGGDNYCYSNPEFYAFLNRSYRKAGFRTVLWGCSVEPKVVTKRRISEDFQRYCMIMSRESISFNALSEVNKNTLLAPDPAFFMDAQVCSIPELFMSGKVIGINASPMILSNETKKGIAYQNYFKLIRFLLKESDYSIALIPHVVWSYNDDREVLRKLYDDLNCPERIALIEDHTAPELKYIISRCDAFIGARTHATIAAYSSAVPTFVVGYSVKARGIAKDLFGTTDGYVVPVQELIEPDQLINCMRYILDEGDKIKAHLSDILPKYKEPMKQAVKAVNQIAGGL